MARGALVIAALAAVAVTARAAAQRPASGFASLAFTEHRVDVGFGVERTAGPVLSAGVVWDLRPRLAIAFHAGAGRLPSQSAGANARDLGELDGTGRLRLARWLIAEAGFTARSYSSSVGRQRWMLIRTGAEARLPLAWGGATGVLRAAYLPLVAVPGLPSPRLAFAAGAGMEYAAGPVRLGAVFELERYDFNATVIGRRLEQLASVAVAATLPLGRKRG